MRKLEDILPQSQFFLVYHALVEIHLRYGNLIWGHLPEMKLCANKDQTLTKRLSVEKTIKYDQATMVHKILKEMCPDILIGKFIRRTQISKYETRRTNDPQIPKLRV